MTTDKYHGVLSNFFGDGFRVWYVCLNLEPYNPNRAPNPRPSSITHAALCNVKTPDDACRRLMTPQDTSRPLFSARGAPMTTNHGASRHLTRRCVHEITTDSDPLLLATTPTPQYVLSASVGTQIRWRLIRTSAPGSPRAHPWHSSRLLQTSA